MNKPSIYGMTLNQLAEWLSGHDHKPSRAVQVWNALYRKRVSSFDEMLGVHHEVVEALQKHFSFQTMTEHIKQESADGTIKFLFKLHDGHLIETVLMKHKYGLSVCVTTQVGCNIGCSFCASGLLRKSRDLSSGEIVEQIMQVQRHLDRSADPSADPSAMGQNVSHCVVMGIGEPFDNFDNLVDFIRIVTDHKGLAIGPTHITVSTSGLADKLIEFADADLRVNLAVSLHAPNDQLRTRIMKINKAFPIAKLMEAMKYYLFRANRKITIEYILLKEINDQPEHARELAQLLEEIKRDVKINLIPYNPVDEHSQYQRSDQQAILDFYDVIKKHGMNCSVRLEHGVDIDAACGQLRSKQTH